MPDDLPRFEAGADRGPPADPTAVSREHPMGWIMHKRITTAAAALGLAALAVTPAAHAAYTWNFTPIPGSAYAQGSTTWDEPFVVPNGFCQTKVQDESDLDVYPGVDDLHDMNTVNETGALAGRYLYNTYEVGAGGAVGITDLATGDTAVLAQRPDWNRLDGIRWTPWGSLLITEETTGGMVHELTMNPDDPTEVLDVAARPQLGVMRHEGIDLDADGNVYVVDELNGGSLYRFEPTTTGDLSDGQLFALKLEGLTRAEQKWDPATFDDKVGDYDWMPLDMAQVVVDTDAASNAVDATEFGRPEDVEVIGERVHVANTSEDRTISLDLRRDELAAVVQKGVNTPVEDAANGVTGFNNPDNLAEGPRGELFVAEDNDFSDVWVVTDSSRRRGPAHKVELFSSLVDENAETTGIYFSPFEPDTLYLSVQHPDKPQADGIWKVQPC